MTGSDEAAAAVVADLLAHNPELHGRRVGPGEWSIAIPGRVRSEVVVSLHVGAATARLSCFLLRGPRGAAESATLHTLLLRRNAALRRVCFGLDEDGDVVVLAGIPTPALEADLDLVLAEILTLTESAFEALVHLAYPGVFPPLTRSADP